jgi:hypothetical protein
LKAKTLSFVGRVTLARLVIQALPSYVMQTVMILVGICDEIDQKCRGFIWGDHENIKKPHLVNWNYMDISGLWNMNSILNILPSHIIEDIKSVIPLHVLNGEDSLAWQLTSDGNFSLESAYESVTCTDTTIGHQIYRAIWNWLGSRCIQCFIRKLSHACLLTNVVRCRRRMAQTDSFPLCNVSS